jgi:dTDP-4-amino-4,6-dideoxygalactose transaminase
MKIPVNRPYQPPFAQYQGYLEQAYARNWLTNNGPLVQQLKERLEAYLGVKNLLLVANGTLAMQLAYKVLHVKNAALTTPFTFIASSSSLQWEGIRPEFADIDPASFNLNPADVLARLHKDITAVVPVHVYGNPCDVHAFERIRKEQNLKVIYDAAHAFGIQVDGQSVLNFGDASTLSFHATKVFHSVEGGAAVFADADAYAAAERMTNFGIDTKNGSISGPGINCKMSEAHAAMGLAVLDNIDEVMTRRQGHFSLYQSLLKDVVQLPTWHAEANFNGSYFPILLRTASEATTVFNLLAAKGVAARRYFAPSISTLADYQYPGMKACVVAEDYATRTLCLPLYFDLTSAEIKYICDVVRQCL